MHPFRFQKYYFHVILDDSNTSFPFLKSTIDLGNSTLLLPRLFPSPSYSIMRMWEAGIMAKLTNDEFARQELQLGVRDTDGRDNQQKLRTFALRRMASAFALLAAGIFIAGTSLLAIRFNWKPSFTTNFL